jgi:phosphohistidine phosphatase
MNLYLFRHGLAVERGTDGFDDANDSERPLTAKGQRKLKKISKAMKALDLSFDLILSSPYLRTRQTAEVAAKALKLPKKIRFSETLTPEGDSGDLITELNRIKPRPEDVLLVGHEPYLSELIGLLVCDDSRSVVEMKKGGLCKLTTGVLKHGRCACLEWLLTPEQMELIAKS